MFPLLLIYLLLPEVLTVQERFRSILIERACRKRPSLSFCSDYELTVTPKAEREVKLVVPPLIQSDASVTAPTLLITPPQTTNSTLQIDEVDFDNENKTGTEEHVGSLVKLPKPKNSQGEVVEPVQPAALASNDVSQAINVGNSSITPVSIEDEKTVLVFVSEYCVVHRELFVKSCHGDVPEDKIPFCKDYPSSCASANGVIPVLAYCQRYYKHYPKFCSVPKIEQELLQFCFAFEQFCLPELTPLEPVEQSKSSLRRCEEVLPEARKVCNPFPHPKDTFNVLRCSNFITNCKKFVDWI
ncbi:hypothetical protein V3C99_015871 [Haemonchus contortus]